MATKAKKARRQANRRVDDDDTMFIVTTKPGSPPLRDYTQADLMAIQDAIVGREPPVTLTTEEVEEILAG